MAEAGTPAPRDPGARRVDFYVLPGAEERARFKLGCQLAEQGYLALACDLRFCSTNAEFALQDVRWGFHACDGGLVRLPQIVGLGNAMEIVLSGQRITSQHALRIGLVNAIHPDGELLEKTLRYADMLASRAPLAQRFAKDVLKRAVGMPMDEALRLESRSFHDLGHTKDLAEGTASFREKRPPRFSGH